MARSPRSQWQKSRGGFALIEFTIIAVPMIFLTLSIIEASIGMWQYHSMAFAVDSATRLAVTHGRTCTQNGNTCSITLGTLTTYLVSQAPALEASKLNLTLYTHASTTACYPLTNCTSSTAQFPDSTDNAVNFDVNIVVSYPVANPMPMLWPGSQASPGSAFTLSATSRQRIVF